MLLRKLFSSYRSAFGAGKHITYRETRHLAIPAALTTIVLCIYLIVEGFRALIFGGSNSWLILPGIVDVFYSIALYYTIVTTPSQLQKWRWITAFSNALCVVTGLLFLPDQLRIVPQIIMVLIAAITVILWDRITTYIFILITIGFYFLFADWLSISFSANLLNDSTLLILGFMIVESMYRLSQATQTRIQRLESLNEFARKIVYSLETDEVLSLVGAAIQNAINADTYFLGIMGDDETIHFDLIFDDGEYFPASTMPIEGTLSGWVVRNQSSLFIPDMRNDVNFEKAKTVSIGKNKTNLSWMGVPMRAQHVNGVVSVGSYTPNRFDRTDFELLENLVQHAALALDNAFHHAEVEAQSHTDSLTSAYNHNHIVEILHREAAYSQAECLPLSLIMLDVDHFKQYNDNYGHMVGDQVLILLTEAIRTHINATDSIGRWGGEEFTIVLPNTDGLKALTVAQRIQQTMNNLLIRGREGKDLPAPTVSQGIAVFPNETEDIHRLIDLADQRLYVAKERGRNQVEPGENHWKHLSN
jgi:diguanylate cyclase (GGDEF)-like protein